MTAKFFHTVLFILFTGIYISLPGQEKVHYQFLGAEYNYGGVLRHSNDLPALGGKRIQGITLTASRLHTSKAKWEQCYCYPVIGAGVAAFDYDAPQILGKSINAFMYVAPYLNPDGKLRFIPRGAAGFSYVSKIYDEQQNPENTFFSSHYSFFLQLHLSLRYEITPNIEWEGSFSYNHISNGGTKQPNKGMNFVTANTGINYYLTSPEIPEYQFEKRMAEKKKKWYYAATCFFSLKVAKATEEYPQKNCPIGGCNVTVNYFIPRFSLINFGVEYIADTYLRTDLKRDNISKDYQRIALLGGHSFKFGKLAFTTDFGIYLYSPYSPPDPVYQHYRLTYQLGKHLMAGVGLKAHRHVAELMMVNAGVRF